MNNEDLRGRAIAAMKSLGSRGRTSRVPVAVRELVLAYVTAARRSGWPWRDIARDLGLSATVLQRWQRRGFVAAEAKSPASMLPVVVRDVPSAQHGLVTLVMPSGLRIEGLAIVQAAELIARLS